MKTIANEAGVTLTTVSRILNHKGDKYANETKEKIFGIAERLKYRPNALVRGMQTGRTQTAGVMIPATQPFYCDVIAGIHEEFLNHDTIMLLSWNTRTLNEKDVKLERQILYQMVDRRVDGIILRPSSEEFESSYFEEIWQRNIPLILLDREMESFDTDFVGTDGHLGGRRAAEYLLELGHRNLLFVGQPKVSTAKTREAGFAEIMTPTANTHYEALFVELADMREDILSRLRSPQSPTAIFCYNDSYARAVALLAEEAGLSIPEDLSLVGFGNQPTNERSLALTTFDQHPHEIGATAARRYLECIDEPQRGETKQLRVPPDLLIRGSTAPRK